ncbi:MAG: hypothetical protein CMP33_03665 [Rickettsiales bacterium]|nr:hypothetical protein [Rickettsiales bacterium]
MVILGIFAFGVVMVGIDGYLIKDVLAELQSGDYIGFDISGILQVTDYLTKKKHLSDAFFNRCIG